MVTDTEGNAFALAAHTADIQDRDGGSAVIERAGESYLDLACIFADGGYAGHTFRHHSGTQWPPSMGHPSRS